MDLRNSKNVNRFIGIALVLAAIAAYMPVRHYEFLNYDDATYITNNPQVKSGITWRSMAWAFTTSCGENWHPLTWLSHMLDWQLFGGNAGGHHLVNLFFHIINTLLLFGILNRMTGSPWPSGFVAAAFALHPLHVESVAWIAERKDVLSGMFWLLTMGAYLRYVRRPGLKWYAVTMLVFALGLMAKPMLVTLPFVLLLLDWWPLGRLKLRGEQNNAAALGRKKRVTEYRYTLWQLFAEKIPLFVLTGVSSAITMLIEAKGTGYSLEELSFKFRLANAVVSYFKYIGKIFWPERLAVLYPYMENKIPLVQAGVAAGLLLAATVLILYVGRRKKYLTVGWLWFLGTLVPVIGLVQVGIQAMADRYTYIPATGIFIMVAWGAKDLAAKWRADRVIPAIAAATLIAMMMVTRVQLGYWKNTYNLCSHAVAVTENNYQMHNCLGLALSDQGQIKQAIEQYKAALQANPNFERAHYNLAVALVDQGKSEKAQDHYLQAIKLQPEKALPYNGLGCLYKAQGNYDKAIEFFKKALAVKERDVGCWEYQIINNLADTLAMRGDREEAIGYYRQLIRLKPEDVEIDFAKLHNNLALTLAMQGKLDEAIYHYHQALKFNPNFTLARENLAKVEKLRRDKSVMP